MKRSSSFGDNNTCRQFLGPLQQPIHLPVQHF